ncbi:18S rRNA biogenesis protein RCL1 [Aphanomyces astaci]|uniref:18S rRNA biogenesis protein RCL1 n=1 Tax=Aphanomyces astaci TaxID=112090 RepID=W4GYG5_APHAT|nr:18S rRNA biogenesis protein RCL1 [Aphanomyces astaci]ETV84702.1 18S rRNA biogenesis protein RCL1 [Aphanomyces astaci]|eukprot:XP_009826394.1 18S rRNA biogenesis protein RCL1 [Aphanomyces astaci]
MSMKVVNPSKGSESAGNSASFSSSGGTLKFKGCAHFRQRLICATLSGRRIRIDNIRGDSEEPGITEFEANFLRLLDSITNGSQIEINETGTVLKYTPGFIVGGTIEHDCGTKRAIGWFLEALVALAPFAKRPLVATLKGITNDDVDASVDFFKAVTIPLIKQFGLDEGLDFKVKKRGAPPLGGGEVIFRCPTVRQLKSIHLIDEGFIKRIRGVAYCTRVSPQTANRIVDTSRGLFNKLLPDVYIYSDHYRGTDSGLSPGYALSLVAESTTGVLLGAETAATSGSLPEDVASMASHLLCEEIQKGGCVDTSNQCLALLLMTLSPEDVSKVRFGKLTPYSMQYLRHLRDFFGVTFKIKADHDSKSVLLSCLGIGFKNLSKKVT